MKSTSEKSMLHLWKFRVVRQDQISNIEQPTANLPAIEIPFSAIVMARSMSAGLQEQANLLTTNMRATYDGPT